MDVVELASGVSRDGGVRLNLNREQRAQVHKLLTQVEGALSSEALMLPSRDHPVVRRALVDVVIPDPVVALDFRMGYDAATLSLACKRISRSHVLLNSTSTLSGQDIDDLCASLCFARSYITWLHTLEDAQGTSAREARSLTQMWEWLGIVIHALSFEDED